MNQYSKLERPGRDKLESLYNQGLTQKQIGEIYGVTYQTIVAWMKKHGVKSRGNLHIVKHGSENPQWRGNKAGYAALHYRVNNLKGKPMKCEVCGTTKPDKTYEWACVGDYRNMEDYKRMCRSCHHKHDLSHLSNINRRKQFDLTRFEV